MSSRHILLTGPPGVGKTTLIKKACAALKGKNIKCDGFFTEEIRNGRERIGFDIVSLSEQRGILARISDPNCRNLPKVGKYAVNIPSFEALALPVFDSNASILVLDEIGKMESFSKCFLEKVRNSFSRTDIKILATIPVSSNSIALVDELRNRKDCILFEVTRENRNNLVKDIVEHLLC